MTLLHTTPVIYFLDHAIQKHPQAKAQTNQLIFCHRPDTLLAASSSTVISRSTALSTVSGNLKLTCKKVGQFLANLTQLHNLPMVGLQYDDLMTQLSTGFVDNWFQ
jgi:hypothetical protein